MLPRFDSERSTGKAVSVEEAGVGSHNIQQPDFKGTPMINLMNEAYQNCKVGETGWVRPLPDLGITIDAFQSVKIAAEIMQSDGKIFIREMHRESQSGNKHIDAIQFVRVC